MQQVLLRPATAAAALGPLMLLMLPWKAITVASRPTATHRHDDNSKRLFMLGSLIYLTGFTYAVKLSYGSLSSTVTFTQVR